MEYRPLDITVVSAEGLKNVNLFMKMGVYVVVSLNDDSISKRKTHISYSGSNPKWNHRIKITLEESSISQNYLLFQIRCSRVLGDKDIGEVLIPLCELLDGVGTVDNHGENVVTYAARTFNGKCKGNLKFSYKFGEVFVQGGELVNNNKKNKSDGSARNKDDGSVMGPRTSNVTYQHDGSVMGPRTSNVTYQHDGSVMVPRTSNVTYQHDGSVMGPRTSNVTYQPQPGGLIYALPQPGLAQYQPAGYPGYFVYPPQQYGGGYNVYPPGPPPGPGGYSGEFPRAPPNGYLYQPQQPRYYYSGELPKQQVQQSKHQKMANAAKIGLGLGTAGLIGGMLVGEMISDIGDMAAAAGCNGGLEDAVSVAVE